MARIAIAHGGASSLPEDADGPAQACTRALALLGEGRSPLEAAVEGCALLEDDPRFNAGTGSNLRLDGRTIEMDASCMTGDGKYGAVACVQDVRNPIRVALALHASPHHVLAGPGATAFARELGFPPHDVRTTMAARKFEAARQMLRIVDAERHEAGWSLAALRRHWNYEVGLKEAFEAPESVPASTGPIESDTVGVLCSDGRTFAGASSTGGTISTLLGRVGDVPMPGCGLHAGPNGAVAVTGDGDFLARAMLARAVYEDLETGTPGPQAVANAIQRFPDSVDVGVILLHGATHAAGSNRGMAWAVQSDTAMHPQEARA